MKTNPIAEFLHGVVGAPTNSQIDRAVDELIAGASDEVDAATRRSLRRVVALAGARVAELRAGGNNGDARTHASDTAAAVVDIVGTWTQPRDETVDDITDPRELAARVPRR